MLFTMDFIVELTINVDNSTLLPIELITPLITYLWGRLNKKGEND